MIFEPRIFYDSFMDDYHLAKATYLKRAIDSVTHLDKELLGHELNEKDRKDFKRILKADLRQNYFHSIETFFELFFALNPKNKGFNDEFVLRAMTDAKWRQNSNMIQRIAKDMSELDFLDEQLEFPGHTCTIGHYLFYHGTFNRKNFPAKYRKLVKTSVEAIKYGIHALAKDYQLKNEYNAYKHGMRIIPTSSSISLVDQETMEPRAEFDTSDSMSFYEQSKDPNKLTAITRLFDSDRDDKMTRFCSGLIYHLISYRRMAFDRKKNEKKEQFEARFYDLEKIKECEERNVPIGEMTFTVTMKPEPKSG